MGLANLDRPDSQHPVADQGERALDTLDRGALDRALSLLQERKARWARLPIADKIRYLEEVRGLVLRHAGAWVAAGAALKSLPPDSPLVGSEEWITGPYPTVAWLTDVIRTLEAIRTGRDVLDGVAVRTIPHGHAGGGQVVARVMPTTLYDRLLLSGYDLDVWMQPGVTEENLRDTIGVFYRQVDPPGRVALVLGAGNVSAIPMLDTLYSLVADGDVVILKMSPINQDYGPVFEKILTPLIRDGYVQLVYGGADVGEYLVGHDLVETVHVTGSERTYAAILASVGTDAAGQPVKPLRAELGGVGPTVIIPGPWTDADIAYQAEHLATQKLHTSGHTCVASQVLVLPGGWNRTDDLTAALRQALSDAPERPSFYPGTAEKQAAFRAENPTAEALPTQQERTLLVGVDPRSDHAAFRTELFGPMYVTTSLPGGRADDDVAGYLRRAVEFANDKLHGNLGANLIVHPETARRLGPALDQAITELRYGCVGVNAWSAYVFLASRGAWGAYPGNTPGDIQSGIGAVHNSLLFDKPHKNVIRAPFRPFPRSARHLHSTFAVKPPWFVTNRTALATVRQLTRFAAEPRPQALLGLCVSALRG